MLIRPSWAINLLNKTHFLASWSLYKNKLATFGARRVQIAKLFLNQLLCTSIETALLEREPDSTVVWACDIVAHRSWEFLYPWVERSWNHKYLFGLTDPKRCSVRDWLTLFLFLTRWPALIWRIGWDGAIIWGNLRNFAPLVLSLYGSLTQP